MTRFLHSALTLLMTAAVLTGSLAPLAVCHMHAEGDGPHSHGPETSEHHERGHAHHGEHPAPVLVDGADDSSAHLHVLIGCFGFSLPLPGGNESDGPRAPTRDGVMHLGIVRLSCDVVPASRVDLPVAVDVTISAAPGCGDSLAGVAPALRFRAADRALLCETARFERSGVLLI